MMECIADPIIDFFCIYAAGDDVKITADEKRNTLLAQNLYVLNQAIHPFQFIEEFFMGAAFDWITVWQVNVNNAYAFDVRFDIARLIVIVISWKRFVEYGHGMF